MAEWWQELTVVAKWFYGAAVFFSVFFVWQFISALIGLSGGEDVDVDAGADMDVDADVDVDGDIEADSAGDAAESLAAFRLLSIRSILAFFTMFFWAGALYLDVGVGANWAIGYATFWGLGGFLAVAVVVNLMRRMPAGGEGEARVSVGGRICYVKARGAGGREIQAGTPIRVVRSLGTNIIEIEPIDETQSERGDKT
jgi:hypothetical protein